jgi:N-acetyl-gamma-glutamyl-phosphate reductase
MIRVGILGATGYTGLELCRLLLQHPRVAISHVFSGSNVGTRVSSFYPQLHGLSHLSYEAFNPEHLPTDMDVLFMALPHAQSHHILPKVIGHPHLKIVDLSADFRLSDPSVFEHYYEVKHASPELLPSVVPGFPELFRDQIRDAKAVAAPGCYATSVILAGMPLIKSGYTGSITVDAKSGVSGAGRGLKESSLFCEADSVISAYGTGVHRHTAEMESLLGVPVFFSPHLMPMKRGILSSLYMDNTMGWTQVKVDDIFAHYYGDERFIVLGHGLATPSTKYVAGSNECWISARVFEKQKKIVVFSALDNLIKGASGQAIQCMNIMFGFEESLGLAMVGAYL